MTPVVIVAVVICIAVVVVLVRRGHEAQRDPQRTFDQDQRRVLIDRCGNRCEHKPLIGRRCTVAPTHMDHIYPWSKGGSTTLANGQALCVHHNLKKSARIPSLWYIRRLKRRRLRYFPAGQSVEVVWKLGVPANESTVRTGHRYRPVER